MWLGVLWALFVAICAATASTVDKVDKNVRRIVAVGDFHGDLPQVRKVLRMAGLVDKNLQWTGGPNTDFVQTGDVVDRGPDTIQLYQLLGRLYNESLTSHHGVYPLLGNHEIMNLSGDLRYVTSEDTASFGGASAREHAWSARGWIGAQLRERNSNVTLDLAGNVFVHGGITAEWAQHGVEGLNALVRDAMHGAQWRNAVFSGEGPFWYRGYAMESERTVCGELRRALKMLKAKRMIIGHTPQYETGRILSRCNGSVYVIDVGISSAYGANCAALEIMGDTVTALYCVQGKPDVARRVDMTPKRGFSDDSEL
ncbi:Metallo-dependent phosphatase-like protein [Chytriomyces sp. MP71]|nr:Metallo-dependent phosphatase-like protein [Chytriomyces sp. MP71]